MAIADDQAVSFNYTLRDEQGEKIESNDKSEPLVYLHGHGNMMPGIEKSISEHSVGDSFTVRFQLLKHMVSA